MLPPSSNRRHWSNGDCLESKRENYQVFSVQYCVQQLCTVQCTRMNRPNSCLLVRLVFLWLYCVLQYICVRFSFLGLFCVIFSVLVKRLARKSISEMTYFVSSVT